MVSKVNIPFLTDLLHLFYPRVCAGCDNHLQQSEKVICRACTAQLPKTNYSVNFHPLADRLNAQFPFTYVHSLYYFNRKSLLQHLMHQAKYRNRKDVAYVFGEHLGQMLNEQDVDTSMVLIPVPLHKKKQVKRGYNQSLEIAKGINATTGMRLEDNLLKRGKATETQTGISRVERFNNLQAAFEIKPNIVISEQHFLLVDDVITTGATVLACAQTLAQMRNVQISVTSIGVTEDT